MHPTTIFRDLGRLRAEDLVREAERERLRGRSPRTRRGGCGNGEAG
jgi:hypothetical protein